MNDSVVETKKSSKPERTKSKEERHKGHKSRSSRRSKASEPHEIPDAPNRHSHVTCDTTPCAPQTTRLKELLSPASCNQPPTLKPRPPSTPKVREQPSTSISSMDQTDTITRECIPLKKRDAHTTVQTAPGKTDALTSAQKHRNHKEQTSEKAATKDQTHTPSLRRSSSSDRRSPSRKTQAAAHAPIPKRTHRGQDKEQRRRRNEAARIIQRAWRRFHARRRREAKACEEVESSDLNLTPNRKKMEIRAPPAKPAASKSSVLQSIYGNSMARRGRSLRGSQSQLLLDMPLRTQSQLSGIDCVHLTEAMNQAKQYSYHLRPHSAGQGTRGRGKH